MNQSDDLQGWMTAVRRRAFLRRSVYGLGGIGANREHPAEFFYDNLMMGVQLIHQAWKRKDFLSTRPRKKVRLR